MFDSLIIRVVDDDESIRTTLKEVLEQNGWNCVTYCSAEEMLREDAIGSLSPIYNFVMMVDMEMMLSQPETYVRLIPNFFFRQSNFFRHFMLAVQFTCTEGVVYPNIVLLYKG